MLRVLCACSAQEKRLRLDMEESVGRVRARAEGLGKSLEQAKGELVSLLNAKVWWYPLIWRALEAPRCPSTWTWIARKSAIVPASL